MKILLIKPLFNRNLISPAKAEPLELEYLAASVKEHEVEILDMRIDKDLMKKLDRFRPHFVGITAYTCDVNTAKKVLIEVKRYNSRIKTAVGGQHATFLPNDFKVPFVDVVFLGMSDFSFKEFIKAMDEGRDVEGTNNIALVKENDLIFTEKKYFNVNLDMLPFPARHLTLHHRKNYRDETKRKIAFIMTSRGCPFKCTFCACWKMMNGKYITRSPESVVEELASLPEDIDLVCFADDNTLHSIRRAWDLVKLIKKRKIKKKFSMYARADTIAKYPYLIESLRDVGLKNLTVGLEAIRDEELDKLNRINSKKVDEYLSILA